MISKFPGLFFIVFYLISGIVDMNCQAQTVENTFCNPLNLNYRFMTDLPSRREAADPVILLFKGKYYLFASKSGGYWFSTDLLNWKYRPSSTLPVEEYAPTVAEINDTIFFISSNNVKCTILYNTNPLDDNWKIYNNNFSLGVTDPAIFKDDDNRVYLYYGCSNVDPIYGIELNVKKHLDTIGTPVFCIGHNRELYGWEENGELNDNAKEKGWNEGAWMIKHNGKYYLEYASPGTQFKVYGDGVYVSDKPLGPFTYMDYSPFSYKPGGFIGGTGHSCTFADKYGNFWHITTMTISARHMFERRLGLFPAAFDQDGVLRTFMAFGDYPMKMPDHKIDFSKESIEPEWMLLSYNKPAKASSETAGFTTQNAFDENVRTWWSAATGNKNEWLSVDLNHSCTINAIQVNFADQGFTFTNVNKGVYYQYEIFASENEKDWMKIVDKSSDKTDSPHDYIALSKPVNARYVKIVNVAVPEGSFSISGFRIFGKGNGNNANKVVDLSMIRDSNDPRKAMINWKKSDNATGYVVNYGTNKNKLYTSVIVYDSDFLKLTGLNKMSNYFFSIDTFNENGIIKGTVVKGPY